MKSSAIIFGGRSPTALVLCKQLASIGHEVHLVTRVKDEEIIKLAKENDCSEVHQCDLEDVSKSTALVQKIDDEINGLSAVAFFHRYRSKTSDPFKQFAVEVNTPYEIIVHLSKRVRSKQCAIVLATSPAAQKIVEDQDFHYHASKAAIQQLIRFSSVRFAKNNLRVNGVNPGTYVYKSRAASFYAEHPEIISRVKKEVPLGRMSNVEEIATVARFLLTEDSSFINGEIINIDGGLSNRNPN